MKYILNVRYIDNITCKDQKEIHYSEEIMKIILNIRL